MMFGKNEKKKSMATVFLTIGALAMIGAVSITNKGKRVMCKMATKMRSMMPTEE